MYIMYRCCVRNIQCTSCTGIVYVTYNVHGISSVSMIIILTIAIAQTIIRAQCTLCVHVNIAATAYCHNDKILYSCIDKCMSVTITLYIHVLMRDEKEGRKKQARSNKQQGKATQHTQGSQHVHSAVHCVVSINSSLVFKALFSNPLRLIIHQYSTPLRLLNISKASWLLMNYFVFFS